MDGWMDYVNRCKAAVQLARERVAKLLSCSPEEVIFTSCGAESDNWALIAGIDLGRRRKKLDPTTMTPHVITSSIEHPAVLKPLEEWAKKGAIDLTVVSDHNLLHLVLPVFLPTTTTTRPHTYLCYGFLTVCKVH